MPVPGLSYPLPPARTTHRISKQAEALGGYLYTCSSSLARGHGRPMPSWGLEELEVLALELYTGDGA